MYHKVDIYILSNFRRLAWCPSRLTPNCFLLMLLFYGEKNKEAPQQIYYGSQVGEDIRNSRDNAVHAISAFCFVLMPFSFFPTTCIPSQTPYAHFFPLFTTTYFFFKTKGVQRLVHLILLKKKRKEKTKNKYKDMRDQTKTHVKKFKLFETYSEVTKIDYS